MADDKGDISKIVLENCEEWVEIILDAPICNIPGAPPLPKEVKVRHLKHLLPHVPEILPSSLHLEYHDPSQLEDGDVLVICSEWTWKTYAIVSNARERKVICFTNRGGCPMSDIRALFRSAFVRLREVSLDKVLDMNSGVIRVFRQKKEKDTLWTLERARAALEENRRWDLFTFNSEHFVTQAVTGMGRSSQINNLGSVAKKSLLSGAVAGVVTPESCALLKTLANYIVEVTSKKGASKAAASEVAKETAEEVVKQAAKETAEEVAGATAATATSRLASGAKAGFIGGVAVESACLVYTGYSSYKKMEKGEISSTEFRQHMVKCTVAAGGSVTGGTIGAAIGTVILPVPFLGTFIGSVVGGVVGDRLGSHYGEDLDNYLFNQR